MAKPKISEFLAEQPGIETGAVIGLHLIDFEGNERKATRQVGELLNDLKEARDMIETYKLTLPPTSFAYRRADEWLERTPEVEL